MLDFDTLCNLCIINWKNNPNQQQHNASKRHYGAINNYALIVRGREWSPPFLHNNFSSNIRVTSSIAHLEGATVNISGCPQQD